MFRTFLALAGTCAQLRYWQNLRRWIGWLTPDGLEERMQEHGFPPNVKNGMKWMHVFTDLGQNGCLTLYPQIAQQALFQMDIGGVASFFNLGQESNFNTEEPHTRLVFLAPDFAELVLFLYAVIVSEDMTYNEIRAKIMWKSKMTGICFYYLKRRTFGAKQAIPFLTEAGRTAPPDHGFKNGQMPTTAFDFFLAVVNAKGLKKRRKPQDILGEFVQGWFPKQVMSTRPLDNKTKEKRAYEFPIIFEDKNN